MSTYGSRDRNGFVVPTTYTLNGKTVPSNNGSTKYYTLVDSVTGEITIKSPTVAGAALGANSDRTIGTIPKDGTFKPQPGSATTTEVQYFTSAQGQKSVKNQAVITAQKAGAQNAQQLIFPNTALPGAGLGQSDPPAKKSSDPASSKSGSGATADPATKAIDDKGIDALNANIKGADPALKKITSGEALYYPLNYNRTDDMLKIEIFKYQKSGLGGDDVKKFQLNTMTDRLGNKESTELVRTIYLPAANQSGITDSLTVGWGAGELNPLTAQFARVALNTMNVADGGFKAASQTLLNGLIDVADNFKDAPEMKSFIANYFTEQAVQTTGLLSRTAGAAINNNVELLFTGVQLRDFTLTYRMTPREPAEATRIKEIIRAFKVSMTPALSDSGLFLMAPCVYKLSYVNFAQTGSSGGPHPYLNRFKACALKGFNVNYTPDGSYMTYAEGSSMTQYELQFSFGEIDPIYRDDYEKGEGTSGMGY